MRAEQDKFIAMFSVCGRVGEAARRAQINRDAHYRWLRDDPAYAERFRESLTKVVQVLEDYAVESATVGIKSLIIQHGEVVKDKKGEPIYEYKRDPATLRFLLQAYDRARFGEVKVTQLDLKDWDGDISKLSDEQLDRFLIEIEKRQALMQAQQQAALPPASEAVIEAEVVPVVPERLEGDPSHESADLISTLCDRSTGYRCSPADACTRRVGIIEDENRVHRHFEQSPSGPKGATHSFGLRSIHNVICR